MDTWVATPGRIIRREEERPSLRHKILGKPLAVRELPLGTHRTPGATTWTMKKTSLTIAFLTVSGLAGAATITTTTAAPTWPDESLLSIVAPPNGNHLTAKDPRPCYTEDLAPYFDVPLGQHSMAMAQFSYGWHVRNPACTTLGSYDSRYEELCPPIDKDTWCRFSTAPEAADVLPAYSAYGSSASEWWQAHSVSAVALARRCPWNWWWAAFNVDVERSRADQIPMGSVMLNDTLKFAQCYAEAHATASREPAAPAATSGPEARPGSGTAAGAVATGGAALPESGGRGRGDAMGVWMAWGLAALAVTSVC